MKGLLKILIALMTIIPALAQQDDLPTARDAKVRDKIQAARVAYITDQLALTPAEAERFWPIYREFAQKRNELRQQLRECRECCSQSK